MTKQDIKRWWAWSISAGLLVAVTITVWLSPVKIVLNVDGILEVTCESPAGLDRSVSLWPYLDEVNQWVGAGRDSGPEAYTDATIGMIERCGVAREHRDSSLMLLAIASATVIIVTRPRSGGRRAQAEGDRDETGPISDEATP